METMINNTTERSTWLLPNVTGLGGAVAGLLAGVATVALSPLLAWVAGGDVWDPMKVVAAKLLGPAALAHTGFDLIPVLVGMLLYVAGATLLGAIFGALYRRVLRLTTAFGLPVYAGLVYGIITCIIAVAVLLPASTTARAASTASVVPLLVQQMVFALCLGVFYMQIRPVPYQDTLGSDGWF